MAILPAVMWLAASSPVLAQTGTLRVPAAPRTEQPMKPPKAAPRVPVRRSAATAERGVPVVSPHRHTRSRKPETAGVALPMPMLPMPVPPIPPGLTPPPATPTNAKDAAGAAPARPADLDNANVEKLPRFASLRSDDVNMRVGPGTRYRIEWVYKRRDLPVEIERQFEVWRWVRAPDGSEGWMHEATLTGRRSFVVKGADATLRSEAKDTASAVAILKVGVIGWIRSCHASSAWCKVQAGSYRGYLKRDAIWGVLPGEAINR